MGLRDLELHASYDSGMNKVLDEFYINVLKEAVSYKRIAGFFSSTCLAVSARGVRGLIENKGHMQLIVSPRLSKEDIDIMEEAMVSPENILEKSMLNEINEIEKLIKNDHVAALGWLMANGIIDIKVAVVYNKKGRALDYEEVNEKGIFHIKVGIVKDINGDILSFSGSVNETASGWTQNIEEFKVFKMWEIGQKEYCESDIEKFYDYWNDNVLNVKVYNIPEAVAKRIIDSAPSDYKKIKYLYAKNNIENEVNLKDEESTYLGFSLFDYQKQAMDLWHKNGYKLICEMATGTGKTRTAIACMASVLKSHKPIVYFIVCPQSTLALQWKADIDNLNIDVNNYVIADSTVPSWKRDLEYKLLSIAIGMNDSCIVYVTFDTFYKSDFIEIVRKNKHDITYMLIGDEVHGLGASVRARGLINEYDLRIGLSATPDRWFDELGTERIKQYFGNEKFEFTIKDALNTINPLTGKTYLSPYEYIPLFTTLTDDEAERYNSLSKSITRSYRKSQNDEDAAVKLENLMFLRSSVHKSAINKYQELEKILDGMPKDISDLIIFVSDQQMQKVINIVSDRNIRAHKFTKDEGKRRLKIYGGKSEREFIIDKFKEGDYQSLLAIKCLDEGIDIPSANTAILMASNTNPREYIQRIGRIIRRFPGKEKATLYDVIVVPNYDRMNSELVKLEKRILKKEMVRVMEIAENALNSAEIMRDIFNVI